MIILVQIAMSASVTMYLQRIRLFAVAEVFVLDQTIARVRTGCSLEKIVRKKRALG